MKIITILQAAIILTLLAFAAASCSGVNQTFNSESEYASKSTSNSKLVPLVVSPDASKEVRSPDGRYYYRNEQGYIYWKGYNNKYYIDRVHAGQVESDPSDYRNWQKNHNK